MKKKLLIFVIIITSFVFLTFLFFLFEVKEVKNKKSIFTSLPPTPLSEKSFSEVIFPHEIYGFPAKVTSIGDNYLILKTYGALGLKYEEFKVFISSDTIIREILIAKPIKESEPAESEIRKISFSEIQIGDEVAVSARENVAEKKEFTAYIINVIKKTK